jgi:DNA (cytosine-5)-methyltransferase 1
MTHLSLFSGIGGLDLAAEMAGFCTVGQVEIDDYCNRVLEHHWPGVPRWRDVKDVTAETFEQKTGIKPGTLALLSGGFPCQPVSCAGQRKGDTDERWLWDEMLRVICEIRPRWVVAENVRGLLSAQAISDGRKLFGRILRDLAQSGYRVGWLCFGAGDVGAPHKRERVFVMAHSDREQADQQLRRPERPGRCPGQPLAAREKAARPADWQAGDNHATGFCPALADPARQLLNRAGGTGPAGRGEFADGSNVADPDVMHREQCRSLGRMGREGEPDQGDGRGQGPTQPRLGDFADGLPAGLAGYRWPAGPGPQHPWEPPRIATGVRDRVAKLKALGNAVVPAQAYPIFRAIAEIEKAGCMRVIVEVAHVIH